MERLSKSVKWSSDDLQLSLLGCLRSVGDLPKIGFIKNTFKVVADSLHFFLLVPSPRLDALVVARTVKTDVERVAPVSKMRPGRNPFFKGFRVVFHRLCRENQISFVQQLHNKRLHFMYNRLFRSATASLMIFVICVRVKS